MFKSLRVNDEALEIKDKRVLILKNEFNYGFETFLKQRFWNGKTKSHYCV